jgi:hypothetical protein
MVAVRIVGKWLVADGLGTPVTTKERNSFLWKISSLDYSALPDDVAAQPLADLVGHFVLRLSASTQKSRAGDDQVLIGRWCLSLECQRRNSISSVKSLSEQERRRSR